MKWEKRGSFETIQEVFKENIGTSMDKVNDWVSKAKTFDYRIDGLSETAEFILRFKNGFVRILGDYDADGMTSTHIMLDCLSRMGFENVTFRIPTRVEGFGVNKTMIDEILHDSEGVPSEDILAITVDNGIAQADVIDYAKSFGLNVVVVDHHLATEIDGKKRLPNADFIIDPNAIDNSADYNGYCGAGLSYRLACEIAYQVNPENRESMKRILLPIAAIGTVADVMELREENYYIVRYGLQYMITPSCQMYHPGLYELLNTMGIASKVTSYDVGFKIGPALNAGSRMMPAGGGTDVTMALLNYRGTAVGAKAIVERAIGLNNARKGAKREAVRLAEQQIEDECLWGDVPLVIHLDSTVGEGIIGIVAGELSERYHTPVFAMSEVKPGIYKGSARNGGLEYDIFEALTSCSDSLIKYGGHKGAGGFSLSTAEFDKFKNQLLKTGQSVSGGWEKSDVVEFDLEVKAKDVKNIAETLEAFEPTGNGNERIVFRINGLQMTPKLGKYVSYMGDNNSIVKFYHRDVEVVGFDMAERFESVNPLETIDVVGTITKKMFNGKESVQIEMTDFKPAGLAVPKKTALASLL